MHSCLDRSFVLFEDICGKNNEMWYDLHKIVLEWREDDG